MNAQAVFLNIRFKGAPIMAGVQRESGDSPERSGRKSGAVPATVSREWVQIEEPFLSFDLDDQAQIAFQTAYQKLAVDQFV